MRIEKDIVDKNFSKAAGTYDSWAKHQCRIAKTLSACIPEFAKINNLLDLGCGTGNSIESVNLLFPEAEILGVDIAAGMIDYCREKWIDYENINFYHGDVENLELSQKYDLIISSCSLQWVSDFKKTLNKYLNCLNQGGYLALAIPVKGSLDELKQSYLQAFDKNMPGLCFQNENDIMDAVSCKTAKIYHACTELVTEYYDSLDVLRYFKKIGVTFSEQYNYKAKSVKEVKMLMKKYRQNFTFNNRLPISYKIFYLVIKV
ncbi:MAG: methyltransferase domain-containing protein [bacterium]|nr:methyltransferase domain-containing protein [bacterium]